MIPRASQLNSFTDVFGDENTQENISQPISLPSSLDTIPCSPRAEDTTSNHTKPNRPLKHTGQHGEFRSVEEIDPKYRSLFTYPYFNLVQSRIIEDALYSDKSLVLCAPTGSGKTVAFEMAILQILMQNEATHYTGDFKIIYMAPVKAVCNERLTEWYPKLTKLGLLCIEVTGDTEVDFSQLKPYKVIITTPEKWDMLTRRWRDHRGLVEMIKLFLIDEVHILNDETRGPVLEAVVSRMKTIESAAQSAHRIEQLQRQYQGFEGAVQASPPRIRFIAVSATVSNPEDVADWLGSSEKPAVYHKFGDECRPVRLKRIVEGYPCAEGTSIFKFDLILNYKLWSIIQKYYNGKPTLIFCNTRKSVVLTAEALSREITVTFNPEQKAKLTALASTLKNKKLQMLALSGVGCHHAGLLFEERMNIERAFRERDLPILITTTTLAMGVNLPAHLVIIKNTQQYVNGAYQEYSISTVLQMVGRAGRPQFDTEATAVIMTRSSDKARYESLVGGSEPLQSYLHKRIAENLNSEAALGTVTDVAQCVEWLRSTFLYVRAAKDPKRYLGLPPEAPMQLILKKIEELCVKAMNGLASSGLITMDDACCIESTEAGRLMSVFYLDVETMKNIMKIDGSESLERLLWLVCESHELSDMHLRMDERRCLNLLNRNNAAATIRFPMKGKISSRQMKLNCIIQAVLGCLPIPDPSLNQEAMKVMRIASRVCTCLVKYVSRPELVNQQPKCFSAVLNSILLAKCVECHLWENSPYVSKQLKGIGPTFSTLLASAGKRTFMLLEESHPRDLERIMNKGPPAGNVLRKQVSLLPKYQLTATPKDLQTISVQLLLLNHAHLSENIGHLTAGDSHKSYLIVGDSENHLLLLASFSDNDLISVYDGTMTYDISRKMSKQHKIMIHCISSSFAGIDAQAEYLFQSLEPELTQQSDYSDLPQDASKKNTTTRQTSITDAYRERKRRNNSDTDITQCKEKKKRENALTEKLKALKESFGRSSKEIIKDFDKTKNLSCKVLNELLEKHDTPVSTGNIENVPKTDKTPTVDLTTDVVTEPWEEVTIDCDEYDYIDDTQINNILNQIETEINGKDTTSNLKSGQEIIVRTAPKTNFDNINEFHAKSRQTNNTNNAPKLFKEPIRCAMAKETRKRKNIQQKSNYSVIDKIAEKATTDDTDNAEPKKNCGFTDTIKSFISKFLDQAQPSNVSNIRITDVVNKVDEDLPVVYVKRNSIPHNNENTNVVEQDENTNVVEISDNNKIINSQDDVENNKIDVITNKIIEESKQADNYKRDERHKLQRDNKKEIEILKKTIETIVNDRDVSVQVQNTGDTGNAPVRISIQEPQIEKITNVCNGIEHENSQADTQKLLTPYEAANKSDLRHKDKKAGTDKIANMPRFVAPYRSETRLVSVAKDKHFNFENIDNYTVQNEIHTTEMQKQLSPHRYEKAFVTKPCVEIENDDMISSNTENIIDGTVSDNLLDLQQSKLALVPVTKSFNIPSKNVKKYTESTDQADACNILVKYKSHYECSERKEANCSQVENNTTTELVPLNNQVRFKNNAIASYSTTNEVSETDAQNIVPYRIESDSIEHDTEIHSGLNTDRTLVIQSKHLDECGSLSSVQKPTVNITSHGQLQAPCHSNVSYYFDKHFSNSTNTAVQKNSCDFKTYAADSDNQKKSHCNRYCYTATKVNVCTKNMPDHQLRITRKLKVDVDITEIVTEENTKTNTVNLQKENLDNLNNIQNVPKKRPCSNGNFERNFENNTQILSENTKINIKSNENKVGELEVTKVNEKEQQNKGNNVELVNCSAEKSIGKLLQKYSKLLVKSETNAPIINKVNKNNNEGIKTESQLNTGKTKRPFKIRDIHNIEVPLPSTIIKSTNAKHDLTLPVPHTLQTNEKHITEEEREVNEVKLEPYTVVNFNSNTDMKERSRSTKHDLTLPVPETLFKTKENRNTEDELHEVKSEPCHVVNLHSNPDMKERSPSIESPISIHSLELEPEKGMEDENMFNPKMLLEYFSMEHQEPEIIPPPPEFTDNDVTSYSPNTTSYEYHQNSTFNIPCSYADENPDNFSNDKNSNDSRLVQTQKEETWYLSRDENEYETQRPEPISAPWIISQRANSGLVSRRARLGQFKFVRKKPLKPR